MAYQVNIFLLLFGSIQGVLLSGYFIYNKLYRKGFLFLIAYLAVVVLQLVLRAVSTMSFLLNAAPHYVQSYQLPLLYGPLIFLFTKQYLLRSPSSFKDILHFIPFVLLLLNVFYTDPYSEPWKPFISLLNGEVTVLFQLVSLVYYHVQSFRLIKQYYSGDNWLRQLVSVSLVCCIATVLFFYILYIRYPAGHYFRLGFIILGFFIYWLTFIILKTPSIFRNKTKEPSIAIEHPVVGYENVIDSPAPANNEHEKKYRNSGLTKEMAAQIINELESIMNERKAYLQADLTIEELASMVKCKRQYLSEVLNDFLNSPFYNYVNHYRIAEAKRILENTGSDQHKMAFIAYDSGFRSITTFNTFFKKYTGCTPSEYRKMHQSSTP